jgi:UDP-N-acetylglucosamine 2-epimerase (non-hydrolysing)
VTGNTVIDALLMTAEADAPPLEPDLEQLLETTGPKILVTAHRRESWGVPMERVARAIAEICGRVPEVGFVFPIHLNPAVRAVFKTALEDTSQVLFTEPLSYRPFVHVMKAVDLIMTDSGGIQEEAPSVGKPVLVMRDTTERPEGIAAGTAILVGTSAPTIVAEVVRLLTDEVHYKAMATATNPYGDGHAASRIADHCEYHFGLRPAPPTDFGTAMS